MNIFLAKFVKSIIGTDEILYDGKFQVAFVGRSNVGKSSLINSLVNNKKLAKSSSHPGKTKRINFYLINNLLYFVDLPGYGYAKLPEGFKEDLRKSMLWYLLYSEIKNRLVILIVDSKIGATDFDREMFDLLVQYKTNFIVIANKIDKLKMGQREKQLKEIKNIFKEIKIIPYSSYTKEGRSELVKFILNYKI